MLVSKKQNPAFPFRTAAITLAILAAASLSPTLAHADLTWDSSGTSPAAPVDGSGSWDTSSLLWSNTTADIAWPNDSTSADFGTPTGTAGTVTLNAPLTAGGLVFNQPLSGNYLLTSAVPTDTLTLIGTTPTITLNGTASPTINAILNGTNGLSFSGGNSTLILSGANSYSGTTLINSGQLQITTSLTGFGNSAVTVASGGTANANNGGTLSNTFNISGNGTAAAQQGALLNSNHGITYGGIITLAANARIGNGGFTTTFTGGITGTGNLEFYGFSTTGNATFKFNNNIAPAAVYNWVGNTTITAASTGNTLLQFGASSLFPAASSLTLNAASTGLAELDMTGRSFTIGGLNSAGNGANTRVLDNSTGNGTLTINNSVPNTFAGIIASGPSTGTMIVTKTGAGLLTLSNANTYAGNTTVSGGALSVTGSLLSTGIVTLNAATLAGTGSVGIVHLNNAAATINPGATGAGSVGTLTLAGLTTPSAGILQTDLFNAALPATNDSLVVNSAVTFTNATTIAPSAGAQPGTYTVLSAPSITYTATPTLLTPTNIRPGTSYSLNTNATNIQVVITGGPASIKWSGGATGFTVSGADGVTWDNLIGTGANGSNDENFNNAGTQDYYYDGDNVTFDETNSPNHTINITSNVAPGSVTFNSTSLYTLSGTGAITGGTSLALTNSSSVLLTTANTYTGGTSINAGASLKVGDGTNTSAALGSGPITDNGSLTFSYSANPAATANTLSGNGSISLPATGNQTFTLHWTGNNTNFNGTVSINAGNRLEVSGANANLGPAASITVAAGAAFYSNGAGNFAGSLSLAGTGWSPDPSAGTFGALRSDTAATTFSGPVTLTASAEIYVTGAPATLSGNITESASSTLTKAGSNILILSGNNAYSGGTTVAAGTLQLASSTALPSTGTLTLGSALALGSSAANASGILDLNGQSVTVTGLATSGSGTTNTIGSSSTTAPSSLTYSGAISTFSGKIVDAIGTGNQTTSLTIASGNLTLAAANTYTGSTIINPTATLVLANTESLPSITGNGNLQLTAAGALKLTTTATSQVSSLTLDPAATLDLADAKLIIEDTSATRSADIAQLKLNPNLSSSTATAFNTAAGKTVKVLAIVDNAVRIATFPSGSTNFGGTSNVDASSILVTAAFKGDANLDGVVDIQDLTAVANHWQQAVTDWFQGDFDNSGFVDIQDLTAVANNWQDGVSTGGGSSFNDALSDIGGFTPNVPTPEPASLTLLTLGGALLATRRRNKH